MWSKLTNYKEKEFWTRCIYQTNVYKNEQWNLTLYELPGRVAAADPSHVAEMYKSPFPQEPHMGEVRRA